MNLLVDNVVKLGLGCGNVFLLSSQVDCTHLLLITRHSLSGLDDINIRSRVLAKLLNTFPFPTH